MLITLFIAMLTLSEPQAGSNPTKSDILKDRFYREYPRALAELEVRLSRVSAAGSWSTEFSILDRTKQAGIANPSRKLEHESCDFQFFVDGDNIKLVRENRKENGRDVQPFSKTICSTGEIQYVVDRDTADAQPVLKKLNQNQILDSLRDYRNRLTYAPVSTIGPISEMIKSPNFHLVDIESVEQKGKSLLKVNYSLKVSHARLKLSVIWLGYLLLSPDEGWILYEQETDAKGSKRHTKIEYAPDAIGVLLPRKIVATTPTYGEIIEFRQFDLGRPPSAEFAPQKAGLPDLAQPVGSQTKTNAQAWFYGAGVILAILALAARGISRRSSIPRNARTCVASASKWGVCAA